MALATLSQFDFSVGEEGDVAPHLIDARGALRIYNGLLDEDGSIYRRGGTKYVSNAAFGTAGRFIWDGWMHPGRRTLIASPQDFGVLDTDDETVINLGGAGLDYPKRVAY